MQSLRVIKEGEEIMFLMTAKGCQSFIDKYVTEQDRKNFTLGTVHIVCWLIKAIKDAAGNIIGSEWTYIFNINPEGNIPTMMVNSKGPSTAIEAIKGLTKHLSPAK